MVLLDLLGRRWALRIGWELHAGETLTFRELQERCDAASSSVLNDRLRELRGAGIIERADGGYRLTARGAELLELLLPLDRWAKRWARDGRVAEGQAAISGATPDSRSSRKRLRSSPPP